MPLIASVIRRLRRARAELGLSRPALARAMGLKPKRQGRIWEWETGLKCPGPTNLAKWRVAIARERMARRV